MDIPDLYQISTVLTLSYAFFLFGFLSVHSYLFKFYWLSGILGSQHMIAGCTETLMN